MTETESRVHEIASGRLKRGEETEDGQCESFVFNCESIRSRHMEALPRRVSGVHKSISKSPPTKQTSWVQAEPSPPAQE